MQFLSSEIPAIPVAPCNPSQPLGWTAESGKRGKKAAQGHRPVGQGFQSQQAPTELGGRKQKSQRSLQERPSAQHRLGTRAVPSRASGAQALYQEPWLHQFPPSFTSYICWTMSSSFFNSLSERRRFSSKMFLYKVNRLHKSYV